jgi:predicted enzyme related to lactoylglutathione lyase
MARSEAFYTQILGCTFQQNAPTTRMGQLGNLTIVLLAHEEPGLTSAVAFTVESLEATMETVKRAGGAIKSSPYSGPFGEAVQLSDPDGTPLEFVTLSPETRQKLTAK